MRLNLESPLNQLTDAISDLRHQIRAMLANELSHAIGQAIRTWLHRWIVSSPIPSQGSTESLAEAGFHDGDGWSSFEPVRDQQDLPSAFGIHQEYPAASSSADSAWLADPIDQTIGDVNRSWWYGLAGTALIGLLSYLGGPWTQSFCRIAHTINQLTNA